MHNIILTDMKLSPTELIPVLKSTFLLVLAIYIVKYIYEDESLKILVILQIHTRDQLRP